MKTKLIKLVLFVAALVVVACNPKECRAPFFVQISDPQLGFITESEDFSPEQSNMELIASEVNSLKPDFVVFTGDYIQDRTNQDALDGFLKMKGLFNPEIPLYFVPGNHDVGVATPEDVAAFVSRYGHDRFVFEGENYTAIGYNSCIIKAKAAGEPAEYEWLKESLKRASERALPIILAAHHPIFVETPDEADAGVNIPFELREKYLSLAKEYGVDLILSGHLHHCVRAEWNGIKLSTSGAAGRPLGDEGSGFTIVTIDKGVPTATFHEIEKL